MKFEKSENVIGLLKLCAHFKDAIETQIPDQLHQPFSAK